MPLDTSANDSESSRVSKYIISIVEKSFLISSEKVNSAGETKEVIISKSLTSSARVSQLYVAPLSNLFISSLERL